MTTNACTICGARLTKGRALWTTCDRCQADLGHLLASIEYRWPLLSDVLEPVRGHSGPRVSGTKEQALPAAVHALALTGPLGIPTRLYHQYAALALARRIQPATLPPGADTRVRLALYGIRKHLPWAVQGMSLTELHGALEGMAADLAAATSPPADDRPRGRVQAGATCTGVYGDGTECGGVLYLDRATRRIECAACGTEYSKQALAAAEALV